MAKGGALKPVYIVTDEELEINGGDFVLQQGPAMKVRGFSLDNYAGRKIKGGAAQPVYVVPEASAPSLHGGHWRVIAGQPEKVISVTEAERNIIQGPAIPVYPVDDDGNYDGSFAGAFSPLDIAGLILWLRADLGCYQDAAKLVPCVNPGDAIWTWEDQSGNGNDAVQADPLRRPAYQPGILNGHPVSRFDGLSDGMEANGAAPSFTGEDKPVSVFSVTDQGAFIGIKSIVSMTSDTIANTILELDINPPVPEYRYWRRSDGGALKMLNRGAPDLNPHIVTAIDTGIVASVYEDSILLGLANQDINVGVMDIDRVCIGYRHSVAAFGQNFEVDIAEVLLYNSALSNDNRILIETYLNNKYAIF